MAPAVLALGCVNLVLTAQVDGTPFVVRNVRVFDGERVAERQNVVVRDGRIEAVGSADDVLVPPGTDTVSGDGRTLLPGLIDSHVHVSSFFQVEALQQALAFGVTTVVDMWTGPPPPGFAGVPALRRLKELEALDRADLASVRTAGTGATAPGGHPTQMDGGPAARAIPTLTSPGEADAFVAARLAEGSDFIKIIAGILQGPRLRPMRFHRLQRAAAGRRAVDAQRSGRDADQSGCPAGPADRKRRQEYVLDGG